MLKFQPLVFAVGALLLFGACQSILPPNPPYARDTKPRYAKELRVEPKKRVTFKTPEGTLDQGKHILALMNFSSNWTCIAVSLDNSHWLNIAEPIGRTCPLPISEMDRCFNEGKFLPIGKVDCTKPIEVYLKFRNAQGDIGALTSPYHLIPNCEDKVTVVIFTD